jgi:hypothetical protein
VNKSKFGQTPEGKWESRWLRPRASPLRKIRVARLWLAQLIVAGIPASSVQAGTGQDYSILVLTRVPSLCAMWDVPVVMLSSTSDDSLVRASEANRFHIVCNVPFAVRVGGLQRHRAAGSVSSLSEERPAAVQVSLLTARGLGAEHITCTSAVPAEILPCTLLGRSAADTRQSRHPGSWLRIRALVPETGALSGGVEAARSTLRPINVALTARY